MSSPHDSLNEELASACVVLGLPPPFGADEAKSRYRELAKLYHPDVGVLKNGPRFADISRAYDLIEKNFERLAAVKLSVWMGADASHSRIEDLLRQLHDARTKSVKSEARAQQEAEKANAAQQSYLLSHKSSGKVIIGTTLICLAALALGFLAGMVWSYTPPIIPLKPGQVFVVAGELSTTSTQQSLALPYDRYPVNVTWNGPVTYRLEYESGQVTLDDGVATLESTPTVVLESLPALQIALVPSTAPVVTPVPSPTPVVAAPIPALTPTPVPTATPSPLPATPSVSTTSSLTQPPAP